MTILKTYIDEAASGDLLYDDGQVKVISLLENLLQTLSKKKNAFSFLKLKRPLNNKSGIYIWGGVGVYLFLHLFFLSHCFYDPIGSYKLRRFCCFAVSFLPSIDTSL